MPENIANERRVKTAEPPRPLDLAALLSEMIELRQLLPGFPDVSSLSALESAR